MKTIGALMGDREMYHVAADMTVREVAAYMTERRVGAVAVLDGTRLAGIVSERDIMGRVVARSANPDETRVGDVMTRELVVAHAGGSEDLFTIDLGLRGVFVERPEPLPIGETLDLRFRIPGNELPVEARCRVAWWHPRDMELTSKTLPSGVGLEFVEIDGAGARRVRAYLSEYLRRHPRERRFHRRPEGEEEDET